MRLDWRGALYALARPVLFRFDPERIHRLTLRVLSGAGTHPAGRAVAALAGGVDRQPAAIELVGLRFRNRIGVGAGFDKDAVAVAGWAALGLGFVEVGTVTPLAQAGNPRPRLFRLPADAALLNRMGFNNHGAAALARRVMLARRDLPAGVVIGVNLGRARGTDADRAADDYVASHRLVAPVADYLAVNVSSPNTPGLRDLQEPSVLADMLTRLDAAGAASGARPPLLVKLSPDLDPTALEALVTALLDTPAAGVILSNTTTARTHLRSPGAVTAERGGLSGAPLLAATLDAVERARRIAGARLVIVASGGIGSAAATRAALDAGADLVQLWTGLVYRGPGLIGEAVRASA
jgi:dihydroorotate dehydrogenase